MPRIAWTNILNSFWDPHRKPGISGKTGDRGLIRGGLTGVGMGQGLRNTLVALPLSWTDNIFAVIGEETGLIGALVMTMLFALLGASGVAHRPACARQLWHVAGNRASQFAVDLSGAAQRRRDRRCRAADRGDVALYQLWRQFDW